MKEAPIYPFALDSEVISPPFLFSPSAIRNCSSDETYIVRFWRMAQITSPGISLRVNSAKEGKK